MRKNNMQTTEKLKKANILNDEIQSLEDFIDFCTRAQQIDERNAKGNELNGVNRFSFTEVGAYLCTGTQSPHYSRKLHGDDLVRKFVNNGINGLSNLLKEKKEEFQKIFM